MSDAIDMRSKKDQKGRFSKQARGTSPSLAKLPEPHVSECATISLSAVVNLSDAAAKPAAMITSLSVG